MYLVMAKLEFKKNYLKNPMITFIGFFYNVKLKTV